MNMRDKDTVMSQQTFVSPPREADAAWAPAEHRDSSRSLGELFSELTSDMSTLMRKELQLAQAEMTEKLSAATRSVVLMVAGGLIAYAGLLGLLAALVIGLGGLMPYWLSALLVGLAVLIVGVVLVQSGRSSLAHLHVVPEKTVETLKENTEMVKEKLQ
jgi:hypothetical protein